MDRIYSIKANQIEIAGDINKENDEETIGSNAGVINNINNMGVNKYRMQVKRLNKVRKTLKDKIPFD